MEITEYQTLELAAKFIGSVLVLAGIIVTIVHFNKSQSNQLKALEKQIQSQQKENKEMHLNNFQNSFWQQQLKFYIEASSHAAKLTQYELNSEAYLEVRNRFYTLFWGPMSIVEDKLVKEAMEDYSSYLQIYEDTKSEEDLHRLQQKSYQLAKTCRESSIKRWELKDFKLE